LDDYSRLNYRERITRRRESMASNKGARVLSVAAAAVLIGFSCDDPSGIVWVKSSSTTANPTRSNSPFAARN